MAKLTAKKMQVYLNKLEAQGNDLSAITINFRADRDSDVLQANVVEEDLFDSETNKVLESIVLISDTREV